ncbi:hypothetical protein DFQ26_001022 [Actinomortierella ambigua]|nr:hypothetical protein DFQ26_001022 [Actinomortierella ambigua]
MASEARESFADDCRSIEKSIVALQYYPIQAALGAGAALTIVINKSIKELASLVSTFVDSILATIRFSIEILTGNWRCLLAQLASSGIPLLSGIGAGALTIMDTTTDSLINLLSGPFTSMGNTLQAELVNRTFTFDSYEQRRTHANSVKPIEFCTDLVNKISMDFITDVLIDIFNTGLYCVAGLIVVVFLWNIFSTRRGHRSWEKNVKRIKKQIHLWYAIHPPADISVVTQSIKEEFHGSEKPSAASEDPSKQEITIGDVQAPIDEVAARLARLCTNPLLFGPVEYLLFRYASKHPKHQARILWFLEFISQRAAVVCFKIGVVGLIMAQLQLFALQRVRDGAFDDVLKDSAAVLVDMATEVSRVSNITALGMAQSINQAILITESDINFNVMLKIMNGTRTLSDGLTTVENTLVSGVQSAFGQHLLGGMAVATVQCWLINKFERVQRGIQVIEKHLIVDFPSLDPSVLMVNPATIEKEVNNAVGALLGPAPGTNSTTEDPNNSPLAAKVRAAASKMLDKLEKDLRSEHCGKTYLEGARELFPKHNVQRVDALVLTHGHADAFFGLDDLRSWCLIDKKNPYSIPVFLDQTTMEILASTFPYMVDSSKATGGGDIPSFNYSIIDHNKDFEVEGLKFTPLPVEHGRYFSKNEAYWSLGFRFGDVSWISDCNIVPDATTAKVAGSKILFVDGLREEPHPSHFSVTQAIEYGNSMTPKLEKVFIVGFCHRVDHYEQDEKMRQMDKSGETQFRVAYDGMVLESS